MTWGIIDEEARVPAGLFAGPSAAEPESPYSLAEVLTEIVARYAPRPMREQSLSAGWLAIQASTVSIPVMQR